MVTASSRLRLADAEQEGIGSASSRAFETP
jgi:hypothetical protein